MMNIHSVVDTDAHYKIDGITRTIVNVDETKRMLVQNDHNSERLTFEVPRFIDGHDLMTCNVVQVHYMNEDVYGQNSSFGIYEVDDLNIKSGAEDFVMLSWLVSANATKYIGTLNFVIRFSCVTEGNIDYAWNTTIFKGINILGGIFNSNQVVEQNVDILEQWKEELFNAGINPSSLDVTLTIEGKAADARAVGNAINNVSWNNLKNKPFYIVPGLAEVSVPLEEVSTPSGVMYVSPFFAEYAQYHGFYLIEGCEYFITYADEEYHCKAFKFTTSFGEKATAIGNPELVKMGAGGTVIPEGMGVDAPFAIIVNNDAYVEFRSFTGETHYLTIHDGIVKLPNKYLDAEYIKETAWDGVDTTEFGKHLHIAFCLPYDKYPTLDSFFANPPDPSSYDDSAITTMFLWVNGNRVGPMEYLVNAAELFELLSNYSYEAGEISADLRVLTASGEPGSTFIALNVKEARAISAGYFRIISEFYNHEHDFCGRIELVTDFTCLIQKVEGSVTTERWTFELSDGTLIKKDVVVG